MLKLLKWIFIGLFSVVLLVAAITAYLVFGIDPNAYKPELESLAQENNIELKIQGNLGWKVFPALAISVGETNVSGDGIPSVHLQQADFTLDWAALLNRKISFSTISIDGADIQIKSGDEGAALASLPGATAKPAASAKQIETSDDSELPFQLSARKLVLTNSRITLIDDKQQYTFEQLGFTSNDLNLDDKPFPVNLSFKTQLPTESGTTEQSQITFSTMLRLNIDQQTFRLSDAELGISKPAITLTFGALYQADADSLAIESLQGKLPSGEFSGEITARNIQTEPELEGSIKTSQIQLSEWLESPPKGVKTASLSTSFSASQKAVKLSNYTVALDDFTGTGALSLSLTAPRQLELSLNGNQLDIAADSGTEDSGSSAALLTPLLAPLALLEGGKGHIEVNLAGINSDEFQIDNPHINLFANGKVLQLADLSGGIFDGQFQLSARIDLRSDTPALSFSSQLNNIDLQQALAENNDLSGHLDFAFSGKSRGDNAEALQKNLSGDGSFTVSEPRINNLNVEKSYCEMAALVESKALTGRTWPAYTQLDDLKGSLRWQQQKVNLPDYTTRMGNIAIHGNGVVNLVEQSYNMLINANLQGDTTSESGCNVKSKSVRNRDIPFRCQGSFADQGEGSCAPDNSFIRRIVQEKLVNKLLGQPDEASSTAAESNAIDETGTEPEEEPDLEEQLKQKALDSLLRGILN